MKRAEIFEAIEAEREYQQRRWGNEFDHKNTPNDWIAYLTLYAGKAVTLPFDAHVFRTMVLKVATLCVAALEQDDFAPRHYDSGDRIGFVR